MSNIKGLNWGSIVNVSNMSGVRREVQKLMKGDKRNIKSNYGLEEGRWNLTDILTARFRYSLPALRQLYGEGDDGKVVPTMAIDCKFRLRVHSRQIVFCDKDDVKLKPMDIAPDALPQSGDIIRWKNIPRPTEERKRNTRELKRWAMRGEDAYIYEEFEIDEDLCITAPVTFAHMMLRKFGKRMVFPEFKGRGKDRSVGSNWIFEEVPVDYKLQTIEPVAKANRSKKD